MELELEIEKFRDFIINNRDKVASILRSLTIRLEHIEDIIICFEYLVFKNNKGTLKGKEPLAIEFLKQNSLIS